MVNLSISQHARYHRFAELNDLQKAISNQRKAVELADDSRSQKPAYLTSLGNSQESRLQRFGDLRDLHDAITTQTKALELTSDRDSKKPTRLNNLCVSQLARFERLGDLNDLECAISNQRQAVELTRNGDPDKPSCLTNLGRGYMARFARFGESNDLEAAVSNYKRVVELTDDSHVNKPGYLLNLGISELTRFEHLGHLDDLENAIMNQRRSLELTNRAHTDRPSHLTSLGVGLQKRFVRLNELADITEAMLVQREAVELTDGRHTGRASRLHNWSISERMRFERLKEASDLESAISHEMEAIELTDDAHPDKSKYLISLGHCHSTRFQHLLDILNHPHMPAIVAAITSFKSAAQLPAAYPRDTLHAARMWATLAKLTNPLSAMEAYRVALNILPRVAWLGLSTPSRQNSLLEEKSENIGCDAASCAIAVGRLEEAVELLDLGRSVFWQQASSLRGDMEALRKEQPELVGELKKVGRELDQGNFSDISLGVELSIVESKRTEDMARDRRRLVGIWESLVARVRQLPRFEYFLKPTPFHLLRRAATAGHIVIINVSRHGVDAIIFDDVHPIQHVPLPDVDLETLTEMSHEVLLKRPLGASPFQQERYVKRHLRPALRMIWDSIIVPIFDALQISLETSTGAIPHRRIWWYPTGPLTFLPIHAAGAHSVDVTGLVISSYVTTLESLFRTQQIHEQRLTGRPKLLVISQPNIPGQRSLPQSLAEAESVVRVIGSAGWLKDDIIHLSGSDATVNRVSDALNSCSWAHFACHGLQHPTSGMESALALQDGHLKLAQIASKRLASAQFAFLSVC